MKYLLLLPFLLGGIFYGRTSIRANTTVAGLQVKTIHQLDDERLETQRATREAKISKVKKILSKGDPSHVEKASLYVDSATANGIEYWLLPSISILESSGCRNYPKASFNCWGYGGVNLISFTSLDDGIKHISHKLSQGDYYKNKSLYEKVTAYNSERPNYWTMLLKVSGQ